MERLSLYRRQRTLSPNALKIKKNEDERLKDYEIFSETERARILLRMSQIDKECKQRKENISEEISKVKKDNFDYQMEVDKYKSKMIGFNNKDGEQLLYQKKRTLKEILSQIDEEKQKLLSVQAKNNELDKLIEDKEKGILQPIDMLCQETADAIFILDKVSSDS